MAKDVIREENVKRYTHVPAAGKSIQATDFITQNLPMVAMFLKNKSLSWACLFLSIQTYLNEPFIKNPSDESQSVLLKIVFSIIAVSVSYLDLVFPPSSAAALAAKKAKEVTDQAL